MVYKRKYEEPHYLINSLVKMGKGDSPHLPKNVTYLDQLFKDSQVLVLILF